MTDETAVWNQPGYSDLKGARAIGHQLEVDFANGDVALVSFASLGIDPALVLNVAVEDGLTVLVTAQERIVEIGWTAIREATDSRYAAHRRELGAREAERVGRRLRALREDRGLTQSEVAASVRIPVNRLSRLEKGEDTASVSAMRTLLRELGASFADLSGPGALEVSIRTLKTRAENAGVPRKLASDLVMAVSRKSVPKFLARAFNWSPQALLTGVPITPEINIPVQFKAPEGPPPANSPLVHLALSTARLAKIAFRRPAYTAVPSDPKIIRQQASDRSGKVTLESLLEWTWSNGIPVFPMAGAGVFTAAVMEVDNTPIIVIKESRDLAMFWLFDLAHELGHVGLGHVKNALIDVQSPTNPTISDSEETSATEFALELLLGDHRRLLQEVRTQARGSGVQFKFAVERVAARAGISSGLLGIVAAFALSEVGRPLDRWGSATNLAKLEGSGREKARLLAQQRAALDHLSSLDAALIKTVVLGDSA